MMDKIMFHTSIRKSSTANRLSLTFPDMEIQAQMIFESLLLMADSHGRVKIIPNMIKQEAFGFTRKAIFDVTEAFVVKVVKTLHDLGTLVYYEIDGECYAEFTKWNSYQKLTYQKKSLIPDPPEIHKNSDNFSEILKNSKPEEKRRDEKRGHDMKPKRVKPESPSLLILESEITDVNARQAWDIWKATVAGKRKSGAVSEGVLVTALQKLLAAGLEWNAIIYGLQAANAKDVDAINYVLKAARNYRGEDTAIEFDDREGEFDY